MRRVRCTKNPTVLLCNAQYVAIQVCFAALPGRCRRHRSRGSLYFWFAETPQEIWQGIREYLLKVLTAAPLTSGVKPSDHH
jgi:hypothetical protein